jgi:PAP2 superfamily C-terminal
MLKRIVDRYCTNYAQREFRLLMLFSVLFFVFSITVSFFIIGYANTHASNGVTDIILSNIPVFDVDGLFVYGTFLLIFFITALCITYPKRTPFVLDALALFWIIRSIFTSLTHIGPFATQTPFNLDINLGTIAGRFLVGNDYFFSGHVGTPFLMALVFWEQIWLRYMFLAWSVYFSIIVLLGHLHYSIDVASAFFITYSIYHIALKFFPKERIFFLSEV